MGKTKAFQKINVLILWAMIGLAIGCATKPTTTEYAADKVVARSDNRSDRPSWASETKSVIDESTSWIIIGTSEVPGDSRIQASFKLSDSTARGNLAQKLETSVTKIVENVETGLAMEDQGLKALVREISQSTFKNVDIDDRYWEKVIRTNSTGEQVLIMKVFSRLKVSKSDFTKMASAQVEKSKSVTPDIKNKVESIIEKNLLNQFQQDAQ